MRIMSLLCIGILLISGCQKNTKDRSPSREIKVGMTYDEVESLLGRPTAIERGVNQFEFTAENTSEQYAEFLSMYRDSAILYDPHVWLSPPKLEKVGSLIYVAWVYQNNTRIDTHFILVPKINTISKHHREEKYYQFSNSSVKWSESEFNKLSPTEIKVFGKYKVYGGGWIDKKEKIISGYEKKYQAVLLYRTILFDAASGRVVDDSYRPSYLLGAIMNK